MIHQYKLNGYNIVLDVYSGSVHVVDDVAYDIIRLFYDLTRFPQETAGRSNARTPRETAGSDGRTEGVYGACLTRFPEETAGRSNARTPRETAGNDGRTEGVYGAYLTRFPEETAGRSNARTPRETAGDGRQADDAVRETIVAEILRKYPDDPDVTREEILETIDDIEELRRQRKLFTEDIYEPNAYDLKNRHTEVKALCLHVAHTCNLNCSYCFASQGNFNGERGLMSFETGKRALDFLIENSGDRRNLEVDFFGGEPLMNWQVVKDLVKYARSIEQQHGKNFRFTLTTNGVGIDDDVIEFANKEMHNVVLSLDGRKEVHDRLRRTANDEGSYDIIVPKFRKLVEARDGKGYYMRGTFTHNNVDFTRDIFHMADLGFTELSMEPVVCPPDDPFALTEEDLPKLFEQYEILATEMIRRKKAGNGFTFYHYMIDLNHGPCIYKRISGCGSGTEYFAVTPWGDLYPCHQFVGDEKYRMGDIWQGITKKEIRQDFKMCNVYAREECRDCWARLYCSGGCAANAYHATGSITGVYEYGCELFKKRIECAVMMQIALQEES